MLTPPPPFSEPWRTTAIRTGGLALAVGVGVSLLERRLAPLAPVTLFALWFTLGGHFLELLFRNRLRHALDIPPAGVMLARVAYWSVGGALLFEAALGTNTLLRGPLRVPLPWWLAGLGFAGVELLIHLGPRARGEPSFYDGRG